MFEDIDVVLYNAIIILANEWGYELDSEDFIARLCDEIGITKEEYCNLMYIKMEG